MATPTLKLDAYAIVRMDEFQTGDAQVNVKEIVWTLEDAKREVARLNDAQGEKPIRYFWVATRVMFPRATAAKVFAEAVDHAVTEYAGLSEPDLNELRSCLSRLVALSQRVDET